MNQVSFLNLPSSQKRNMKYVVNIKKKKLMLRETVNNLNTFREVVLVSDEDEFKSIY